MDSGVVTSPRTPTTRKTTPKSCATRWIDMAVPPSALLARLPVQRVGPVHSEVCARVPGVNPLLGQAPQAVLHDDRLGQPPHDPHREHLLGVDVEHLPPD